MEERKRKAGTAPEDWPARIKASPPRIIAGYWTTRELSQMSGVSKTAILMHVHRGTLKAIRQGQPQTNFYTDDEVLRWLTNRVYRGQGRRA